MGPRPFRVFTSQSADEELVAGFRQAEGVGVLAEAVRAAEAIRRGLNWYADELGESRGTLNLLGELRWVGVLPLTAWFCVDLPRRIVWVNRLRFVPRRPRG